MSRPEDEYTDEPRRPPRRRDDDFDYGEGPPDVRGRKLSGMDGMFANTNMVLLILFAFCCNGIALILGIVGLVTCRDEKAKQNALIVTIIGGIITAIGVVVQVAVGLRH
jgi:hypothetical protein